MLYSLEGGALETIGHMFSLGCIFSNQLGFVVPSLAIKITINNKAIWVEIRPVGTVGQSNNSHEHSGFSSRLDKLSNYLSSAGDMTAVN